MTKNKDRKKGTPQAQEGMKKEKKGISGSGPSSSSSGKQMAAQDERFASVLNNPLYRSVPKSERRVNIDSRFQSMFDDSKFKLSYKVDKRGRPFNTTTDENLRKYYHLEGEDSEDEGEKKDSSGSSDSEEDEEKVEIKEEEEIKEESADDDKEEVLKKKKKEGKEQLSETVKKKLHSNKVDYARGEGLFVSEESSDSESSSEEEEEDVEHEWGELDKDAPRTEEATRRLALCNMDWDRLKAADLMVLFNSFLPPGGILVKASIFPSEFGKQRMAEEELKGPIELAKMKIEYNSDDDEDGDSDKEDDDDDEEEGSKYQREKLRQYQLNRLKYFYAVLEFDSPLTAENVYTECDGMEYESSAAKIDLRFVPDDMTFDDEPRETCEALPDSTKYRPKFFTTTALQQVKVDCTWDETDLNRQDLIKRIMDPKEKIDDDDIKAYLASSSSESEEEAEEGDKNEPGPSDDPIAKYRMLLESIEKKEEEKKKDVELEITWGVGLKEKAEELVKKKSKEEETKKLTPWEERLMKVKEKRRQKRREEEGQSKEDDRSDNSDEDQLFSDDDIDIDMNDPFFKEEMKQLEKEKAKNKKSQQGKQETTKGVNADNKSTGELDLLLLDDDEKKNHFNFKKIIEAETETKSKRKRKLKRKKDNVGNPDITQDDDFQVDVEDPRFSSLYNSHHFNLDPSDPNFKKTKAMEKIIEKKQKHRSHYHTKPAAENGEAKSNNNLEDVPPEKKSRAELSFLVNSIKNKTKSAIKKKDDRRNRNAKQFKGQR